MIVVLQVQRKQNEDLVDTDCRISQSKSKNRCKVTERGSKT